MLGLWRFFVQYRWIRFLFAGGVSTSVNWSVSFILTSILGWWYVLSLGIAFCTAWAVSFMIQKFWTFQNLAKEGWNVQAVFHFILQFSNFWLELGGVYCLVEYEKWWYFWALVVMTGVTASISFYFSSKIFRHKPSL